MKIHSVRLGYATNSSSSHSIIFLPEAKNEDREPGYYGWENFTLASVESKRCYLMTTVFDELTKVLGNRKMAKLVTMSLFGRAMVCEDTWYVDHGSCWSLPRAWGGVGLDLGFIGALEKYLAQDGLVILGGNDNEELHPLRTMEAFQFGLGEGSRMVCRADGGMWTLFNRETGTKVRFDLGAVGRAPTVEGSWRTSTPELVDLKVTNRCSAGCEFCYQASTADGKGAERERVESLAYMLCRMQVFEVAIGGGEPLEWPHLVKSMATFRQCGVVPNFTTRQIAWLRNDETRRELFEHVGAVGFSVMYLEEVSVLLTALKYHNIPRHKYTIQCVEGVTDNILEIGKLCANAGATLLLLGYKAVGRGAAYEPYGWRDVAKLLKTLKEEGVRLSVDTVFAKRYESVLAELGVSPKLYSTDDGVTSAYIDATGDKPMIGPSSYEPEKLRVLDMTDPFKGWPW